MVNHGVKTRFKWIGVLRSTCASNAGSEYGRARPPTAPILTATYRSGIHVRNSLGGWRQLVDRSQLLLLVVQECWPSFVLLLSPLPVSFKPVQFRAANCESLSLRDVNRLRSVDLAPPAAATGSALRSGDRAARMAVFGSHALLLKYRKPPQTVSEAFFSFASERWEI